MGGNQCEKRVAPFRCLHRIDVGAVGTEKAGEAVVGHFETPILALYGKGRETGSRKYAICPPQRHKMRKCLSLKAFHATGHGRSENPGRAAAGWLANQRGAGPARAPVAFALPDAREGAGDEWRDPA